MKSSIIWRAGAHAVAAEVGHKRDQAGGPGCVDVVDDKFAHPRFEQRNGDGAARPAGADQQHARSLQPGAPVILRLHEGEAIEHIAMPRKVGVAAHDAHDAQQIRLPGAGGAIRKRGEFMRHGDQQAIDVGDEREAAHDALQAPLRNLHRHANAIVAARRETAGQALRRFHECDGIADDREQSCLAAQALNRPGFAGGPNS